MKPPDAPIFVPRTPGGKLAEKLKEAEGKLNLKRKVKIVEEGEVKVADLLVRYNPWKGKPSGRVCRICKMGEGDNCFSRCITYRSICILCKEIGTTAIL